MATKRSSIVESTPAEDAPMFIVINQANAFDPINTQRFATEEEAEAKAAEMLTSNPTQTLLTAKLLKSFTAKVEVSGSPV